MKLKEKGCSNNIYIPKSNESITLDEVKNAYKSMERTDFSKMYPIIKQLFHSYVEYMKD